jgi:amino acid transporter
MQRLKFDVVSFVFGALFTGLGVALALGAHGTSWIVPLVIAGIGVAIVAGAVQRVLDRSSQR